MSFDAWISQDPAAQPAGHQGDPGWAFANAARARAQAERQSNRARRRHTWRTRAVLARRALARQPRPSGRPHDL